MEDKLVSFINKHQLLQHHSTVLVGVSGGPDSIALLHFLHTIKEQYKLQLVAITVDHQLRDEQSKDDVAYVKMMCECWGIHCIAVQVDVKTYKKRHRLSTQVAARTLRYEQYKKYAEKIGANYIALGQHGDDQIETVIMSVMRTTNLSGLRGIPLKRTFYSTEIIRPLLTVTKGEIEQYCQKHELHPRYDLSNEETYYLRNNIRANVVPVLKENNPNLHRTVQALTESLRDDDIFLNRLADEVAREIVTFDKENHRVQFEINLFNEQPVSLQRRVFRLILNYLYRTLPDQLSYVHEDIFLHMLIESTPNKVVHFPKGLIIERSYQNVMFYFQADKTESPHVYDVIHHIPHRVLLPNGKEVFFEESNEHMEVDHHTYVFSKSQVRFPLYIRTRKPGDRMSWEGLDGSKKIKDIFIDKKIPRMKRDEIYMIVDSNDEILWLLDMKKGKLKKDCSKGPYIIIHYR